MSETFHCVVIVNGERMEFDVDPYACPEDGTGFYPGLSVHIPNLWEQEIKIIQVDEFEFPNGANECVICDGCEDGPEGKFKLMYDDDRSQHINAMLFEKMNRMWKEAHNEIPD